MVKQKDNLCTLNGKMSLKDKIMFCVQSSLLSNSTNFVLKSSSTIVDGRLAPLKK